VITGVAILGLWAGVFLLWGRSGAADASLERPGAGGEIKQKVDELRTSVLGKNEPTRGNAVVLPRNRPPERFYDVTPREVCLQMKDRYPEQYSDVDCSAEKYSSPDGWVWTPGMQR